MSKITQIYMTKLLLSILLVCCLRSARAESLENVCESLLRMRIHYSFQDLQKSSRLINPAKLEKPRVIDLVSTYQQRKNVSDRQISEALELLLSCDKRVLSHSERAHLLNIYSVKKYSDDSTEAIITGFLYSHNPDVRKYAIKPYLKCVNYDLDRPVIANIMNNRDEHAYLGRQQIFKAIKNSFYTSENKELLMQGLHFLLESEFEIIKSEPNNDDVANGCKINVFKIDRFLIGCDISYAKSSKRSKMLNSMLGLGTSKTAFANRYLSSETAVLKKWLLVQSVWSYCSFGFFESHSPPLVFQFISSLKFAPLGLDRSVSGLEKIDCVVCLFLLMIWLGLLVCIILKSINYIMCLVRLKMSPKNALLYTLSELFSSARQLSYVTIEKYTGRIVFLCVSLLLGITLLFCLASYLIYWDYFFLGSMVSVDLLKTAYCRCITQVMGLSALMFLIICLRYRNIGYTIKSALIWFIPILNLLVFIRCLVLPKDARR